MTDASSTNFPGPPGQSALPPQPEPGLPDEARLWTLLLRGARRRCPRCGIGRLFEGFYTELPRCARCGLVFDPDNRSFGFFYITTAALTGAFWAALWLVRPSSPETAQYVLLPIALAGYLGSMPQRKGISIALGYWLHRSSEPAER